MVYGEDSTSKRDATDGAPSDEDGLESEGADVADKRDVRVDLAWVARLADGDPPDEEHREGCEPGKTRDQREEIETMRVADVAVEDASPEARCCHDRRWAGGQLVKSRLEEMLLE